MVLFHRVLSHHAKRHQQGEGEENRHQLFHFGLLFENSLPPGAANWHPFKNGVGSREGPMPSYTDDANP